MKFGIIEEGKNPPDKRVVLTPNGCKQLKSTFNEMEIIVEKSDNRTFADQEYVNQGIEVVDDQIKNFKKIFWDPSQELEFD